jgi:hypothetical protein
MTKKKWLRIIGLGIGCWSLSLFWPEINQILTPGVTIKIVLGLGVVTVIYILSQYLGSHHNSHHGAGQSHFSSPTPATLMR